MPRIPNALLGPAFAFLLAAADSTRASPPESRPWTPEKGVGTAYLWALGGTLAPALLGTLALTTEESGLILPGLTLILGGTLIGPSAGQFYAGSFLEGMAGLGIRGLGGAFLFYGLGRMVGASMGGCDEEYSDCGKGIRGPLIFGGITYGAGLAFSLVQTAWAVRTNQPRYGSRVDLAPTLALDPLGRWSPGMAARFRF